jgi:glycosyltransferase involved in cell wall biosynthesis
LPTEMPRLSEEEVEAARTSLDIGSFPLVLVVGSQEPRKNHMRVLEASERLWTAGSRFELVFVGGSGWKSESFEDLVGRLAGSGRPVRIVRRASEEELWAAYRLARFTVFPSLVEGFGLPVAESLASGTPAITSRHGSMAEIAEGGGCLLVDPYDVTAIAAAMEQLLEDEVLLERLRTEADERPMRSWAEYADDVWRFLVR